MDASRYFLSFFRKRYGLERHGFMIAWSCDPTTSVVVSPLLVCLACTD